MANTYSFGPGGVRFENGVAIKWAEKAPPEAELRAAGNQLRLAADVFNSLRRAITAFEIGAAVYKDCATNISDLQAGLRTASAGLSVVLAGIASYFEKGVDPFKQVAKEDRVELAVDILRELLAQGEPEKDEKPEPSTEEKT